MLRHRHRALAALALAVAGLTACGGGGPEAEASAKDAETVATAVQETSNDKGVTIDEAIAEDPWGDVGSFVSGNSELLVVNTDEKSCTKIEFDSNDSGADYTISDPYEC